MTAIQEMLRSVGGLFRWWVIVAPWEQAVRVRLGNRVRVLTAGIYLRVPGLDRVYLQSVRRRMCSIPTQILTTKDGKPLTISGAIGYCIRDIGKLYDTLHHAEDTIQTEVAAILARLVHERELVECPPAILEAVVTERLDLSRYGLGDLEFVVTDYAVVRTYRLIQCSPKDWVYGGDKAHLATENAS